MPCTNCGNPKVYKRGLCSACWWYEWRHDGQPRPAELQRRHVGRLIARQKGQKLYR